MFLEKKNIQVNVSEVVVCADVCSVLTEDRTNMYNQSNHTLESIQQITFHSEPTFTPMGQVSKTSGVLEAPRSRRSDSVSNGISFKKYKKVIKNETS